LRRDSRAAVRVCCNTLLRRVHQLLELTPPDRSSRL